MITNEQLKNKLITSDNNTNNSNYIDSLKNLNCEGGCGTCGGNLNIIKQLKLNEYIHMPILRREFNFYFS